MTPTLIAAAARLQRAALAYADALRAPQGDDYWPTLATCEAELTGASEAYAAQSSACRLPGAK